MANVLFLILGLLGMRIFLKVIQIKPYILSPIIFVLCIIGSYALRNNMFDVYVMLVFGLLGYLLRRTGFATAPLVLGMVLGEIIESNWRRALIMSRGNMLRYFLSRPISVVLLVLVLLSMFTPLLMNYVNRKSRVQEKTSVQK